MISGQKPGRETNRDITLFDSVGFAIEDFSTLRVIRRLAGEHGLLREIDLLPEEGDPKDLYGLIRAGAASQTKLIA